MASRCISRSCTQLTAPSSSSAARAFLQVAPRRSFYSTPPPLVLEFLLPSISVSSRIARAGSNVISRNQVKWQQVKRTFMTSGRRQQTSVIYNPQKDDDGNEMHIEITPRASKRLKEIMTKDQNPNLALRIQVESGGCHGFQYLMSLTTLPSLSSPNTSPRTITEEASPALNTSSSDPNAMPSTSPNSPPLPTDSKGKKEKVTVLEEDDTVFGTEEGEVGAKVVMNAPSLDLLKGSKIDYTMELIGSQFKIVDNPLATSNCGCGTSFDIKI